MKRFLLFTILKLTLSLYKLTDFFNPSKFIENEILFPKKDNLIYLTPNTINEAFQKYEYLIVYFYASWSFYSELFEPKFKKISFIKSFSNNYAFAKFNAHYYKSYIHKYNMKYYPTVIIFFDYGKKFTLYDGEFTKNHFLDFIRTNIEDHLIEINSIEEIKNNFENKSHISYIYFGNNSQEFNIFKSQAKLDYNNIYGYVRDESIIKLYKAKLNSIAIYNNQGIYYSEGKINNKTLKDIYLNHYYPYLMKAIDGLNLLMKNKVSVIFIYIKNNFQERKKIEKYFFDLGKKYRKDKLYFSIYYNKKKYLRLHNYINNQNRNYPIITLIDYQKEDFQKWYFNEIFNEKNFENFIQNYFKGIYKAKRKSEVIPIQNNYIIKKIVSDNFQKEVIDNDKDVLVLFYSQNTPRIRRYKEKIEKIIKKFENFEDYFTLGELNMDENDLENEKIKILPTLKLYKKGEKNKDFIINKIYIDEDYLINFIIKNAGNKFIYDGSNIYLGENNIKK